MILSPTTTPPPTTIAEQNPQPWQGSFYLHLQRKKKHQKTSSIHMSEAAHRTSCVNITEAKSLCKNERFYLGEKVQKMCLEEKKDSLVFSSFLSGSSVSVSVMFRAAEINGKKSKCISKAQHTKTTENHSCKYDVIVFIVRNSTASFSIIRLKMMCLMETFSSL